MKKKAMTIELSNENPFSKGYFYATLELPATEYEIRDALQCILRRSVAGGAVLSGHLAPQWPGFFNRTFGA